MSSSTSDDDVAVEVEMQPVPLRTDSPPPTPSASLGEEDSSSSSNPEKKKKIRWTLDELKKPSWWLKMLWHEKGSMLYFTLCFIFFVCVGTLVDGWHRFQWQAWYSIGVIIMTFYMLARFTWLNPAFPMIFSMAMLLGGKVITVSQSTTGFGKSTVIAIGFLFANSAAVAQTGSMRLVSKYILTETRSETWAIAKLIILVGCLSAIILDTPLVAVFIPVVDDYARRLNMSPSKFMMPTSFSALLGGTITYIGTSSNLVVYSLVLAIYPNFDFPFFEVGKVGGPCTVAGWIYMLLAHHWLLPRRQPPLNDLDKNPRKYLISMRVLKKSPVSGKTIEEAGLRHLRGVFLSEVERKDSVISAPSHDFILNEGDSLLFAGDVHNVTDLLRKRGLAPSDEEDTIMIGYNRVLFEAVIASHSSLIGTTVMECNFRDRYDAAIISIFRGGEPVSGKLGDVEFHVGDTLLMVGKPKGIEGSHNDFVLVSQIGSQKINNHPFQMVIAPVIFAAMVGVVAASLTDILTSSMLAFLALSFTGCITFAQALRSVNCTVLLVLASSYAMSYAMTNWGVANELASNILDITSFMGYYGILLGLFITSGILNAFLNHTASAALMVPIAIAVFQTSDYELTPLVIIIMIAASADFCTPVGAQTNLMVWGPGGYRFNDYVLYGMPLQIVNCFVATTVTYLIYPYDASPPTPTPTPTPFFTPTPTPFAVG